MTNEHRIKGYWIVRLNVTDESAYNEYRRRNGQPIALFGGKFLVRGGPHHAVIGEAREHNVVVEFPSHDAAIACYRSPEYQDAVAFFKQGTEADFVIIGGYDGPQP